jgi:ribonuclease Z
MSSDFKVTLLGTGSPWPNPEHYGPSILIEASNKTLVFDCGRGTATRLAQLELLGKADSLFLTHLHSDHIVGLPDLYLTGLIANRNTAFKVYGPAGTQNMMNQLVKAFEYDLMVRESEINHPEGVKVEVNEIQDGFVCDLDDVKVKAFLVNHGDIVPSFGFRVDYSGYSVVISGDTHYSENLIKYSRDVDVLLHDGFPMETFKKHSSLFSSSRSEDERLRSFEFFYNLHSVPGRAGLVFDQVKPRLAVFYHCFHGRLPDKEAIDELETGTRKTYSGSFVVGKDLMSFTIGDEITITNR